MKFIDKVKNKLFPDEKEILFYENTENKENRFINKPISDDKIPINYKPTTFASTEEISDALKAGNIVIVDTSLLNRDDTLKMINFLGGVMYALNGDMKRINKTTFEFSINNDNFNKS